MNAKTFVTMWGKKCWETVEAEKEALLGRAGSGHSLEQGGQCVCHPLPSPPHALPMINPTISLHCRSHGRKEKLQREEGPRTG